MNHDHTTCTVEHGVDFCVNGLGVAGQATNVTGHVSKFTFSLVSAHLVEFVEFCLKTISKILTQSTYK